MKKTTEASREEWENMDMETQEPIHVSCSRLKPGTAWELLSRESSAQTRQLSASAALSGQSSVVTTMEVAMPQPGGVYLSTKCEILEPSLLLFCTTVFLFSFSSSFTLESAWSFSDNFPLMFGFVIPQMILQIYWNGRKWVSFRFNHECIS